VLNYYNGSHIKALKALYPEVDLNKGFFFKYRGTFNYYCEIAATNEADVQMSQREENSLMNLQNP
jgi:hypothetical protein